MEKMPIGSILNNRYKIISTYKIDSGSIIYKSEDTRFIGSTWLVHQIDISENINSKIYINNLFSTLSFLSKVVYDKVGKIIDYFIEKNYLIVVSEEINGTLLSELIYNSTSNTLKVIKIGLQLTDIVKFLFEKNLIHLIDLNPENIVIDKQGILKIQSFAISKLPSIITDKGIEEKKFIGTIGYIPPEMIDDDSSSIGQHSYIYIIASIMYEYITKLNPYVREDPFLFPPANSISPNISNQLSSLIEKCLSYNPNNRIKTFRELEKKLLTILKNETEIEDLPKNNILSLIKNKALFLFLILLLIQFLIIAVLIIYYLVFLM